MPLWPRRPATNVRSRRFQSRFSSTDNRMLGRSNPQDDRFDLVPKEAAGDVPAGDDTRRRVAPVRAAPGRLPPVTPGRAPATGGCRILTAWRRAGNRRCDPGGTEASPNHWTASRCSEHVGQALRDGDQFRRLEYGGSRVRRRSAQTPGRSCRNGPRTRRTGRVGLLGVRQRPATPGAAAVVRGVACRNDQNGLFPRHRWDPAETREQSPNVRPRGVSRGRRRHSVRRPAGVRIGQATGSEARSTLARHAEETR